MNNLTQARSGELTHAKRPSLIGLTLSFIMGLSVVSCKEAICDKSGSSGTQVTNTNALENIVKLAPGVKFIDAIPHDVYRRKFYIITTRAEETHVPVIYEILDGASGDVQCQIIETK